MSSKLTARQLFKRVPKHGLYLFDCDNKTDIHPTKCIVDAKDKIFVGNKIKLKYGGKFLAAKILKLSGIYIYLYFIVNKTCKFFSVCDVFFCCHRFWYKTLVLTKC